MDRREFVNLLFDKGKEANIEEMEVYINKTSSLSFNVYKGDLENYIVAEEENLSLRGVYKGKMGYSYTEKFTRESLDEIIGNLIQFAESNNNGSLERIAQPGKMADKGKRPPCNLSKYSEEDKINYLLDLEERIYKLDERIKTVSRCGYKEESQEVYIKNTRGLELTDNHTIGFVNVGVVAEEDKNMQTGYSHHLLDDLKEEYKDKLIKDSAGDALAMLGAQAIETGKMEVILRNNVAADLFANYLSVFFANNVQDDLSLMKGKIGQKLAAEKLNIVEDPQLSTGRISRSFDDEGTPTFKKYIIEKGILKTFLYNNKRADKEGLKSTGNGFRQSHKSTVGIMSTNVYVEEEDYSLDELREIMDHGLIITAIHGLHAGINSTSGNFSLSCNGLLVEDGKVSRPVAQITMAGNFYDMLTSIKYIGNDTKYCYPSSSYFGSPSIYIGSLNISGK